MPPFPNPDTYLNHLTPEAGARFEGVRNLCLAVLGATIWDDLLYLPEDIRILRKEPFRADIFCFFFSRLFALTFVLLAVIQQTGPLGNCHGMEISIGIICYFAMLCTTYLFLQRIRTLYTGSKKITTLFSILWLITLGATTPSAFGVKMAYIPGTRYCVASNAERYVATAAFVRFAFDTLVYLAVAYHRVCVEGKTPKNVLDGREKQGSGLVPSGLYGAFLRGGQQYYIMAICLDFPIGILIALPSTPVEFKLMLTYPAVALSASMASRVFRISKEGSVRGRSQPTIPISDVNFAHNPRHVKSTLGIHNHDQETCELRTTAQMGSTLPSHSHTHEAQGNGVERRMITIVFPQKDGVVETRNDPDGSAKDTSSSTFNTDKGEIATET
ncbi:hypothetical protein AGABI2DRAFT_122127 [Agaricus bisporus var. bisporus H97]|uniref:hypothetical protein n=1 Tax=Agaricus bisporus var. bisporus (strain H97 / ATCC MYA-4626 / FGSC 10389) TaxID=936046 RepID=UPI00029F5B37|nr:hypothetical protein AGABI2DRAFT_122127 [Agaricus bisporus var. bisporus H97]EKV43221.1 hypothetical protein AGABI2DRAFT_122127 [Agaricus bisporus var. bisporus H97]